LCRWQGESQRGLAYNVGMSAFDLNEEEEANPFANVGASVSPADGDVAATASGPLHINASAAIGSSSAQGAPATAPARLPAPNASVPAPTPTVGEPHFDGDLDAQVLQADAIYAQVENGIKAEDHGTDDAGTNGRGGTGIEAGRVRNALSRQLIQVAVYKAICWIGGAPLQRMYVAAVQQLLHDYLNTPLQGTDELETADWALGEQHARAYSEVSDADLRAWQADAGFIKFAVCAGGGMRVAPARVGDASIPHMSIAGRQADATGALIPRPVISAGVLNVSFPNGQRHIELENTSGGYRPGALRNDNALAAMGPVAGGVDVHQNLSGDYPDSVLTGRPSPDAHTQEFTNVH
jgi:hypothetical protein